MKIAILTLRVDNNYGGNLQRFALSRALSDMGHDVTVLYFRSEWNQDSFYVRIRESLKYFMRGLRGLPTVQFPYWRHEKPEWDEKRKNTFPFFQKNVRHSPLIWSLGFLRKYTKNEDFDAFIVGSDQVWRKRFTERWGIERFFLDFVPPHKKKLFYAASFGIPEGEYSAKEIGDLSYLYQQFIAVSAREESALEILKNYGWTVPSATLTLDPTLLLDVSIYRNIIAESDTSPSKGDMFCYILDNNEEIMSIVNSIAGDMNLNPFFASLVGENSMSIEQWLRSFTDSEFVVTDSYHGMIFSIIFNKPFHLLHNGFRGNARFESLIHLLQIRDNEFDWDKINSIIRKEKEKSYLFIEKALK